MCTDNSVKEKKIHCHMFIQWNFLRNNRSIPHCTSYESEFCHTNVYTQAQIVQGIKRVFALHIHDIPLNTHPHTILDNLH